MLDTSTPFISYLLDHGILKKEHTQSIKSEQELKEMLVRSEILTTNQILQLEAIFLGSMRYDQGDENIPVENMSALPYPLARKHKAVCISSDSTCMELLVSQSTDIQSLSNLMPRSIRINTRYAPVEQIEQHLDRYRDTSYRDLISSIESLALRVRTIDDYGSSSMEIFFPQDHRREIAEDITIKKLLQRIVSLSELLQATRITIKTESNKIDLSMRIAGSQERICTLPISIAQTLYLALRYFSDRSLELCSQIEYAYAHTINPLSSSVPVVFMPTATGFTIEIDMQNQYDMYTQLRDLAMTKSDQESLAYFMEQSKGMCIISGKEKSGKSFAYYQIIQAYGASKQLVSFEQSVEQIIDSVSQVTWGARIEKDIQRTMARYDACAVSPLPQGLGNTLMYASHNKAVFVETAEGVLSALKPMLKDYTKPIESYLSSNMINIISQRFELCDIQERERYVLSKNEIDTLEQFLSVEEVSELLQSEEVIAQSIHQWSDIVWYTKHRSAKQMSGWKIWQRTKTPATEQESGIYLRAQVDLLPVLQKGHKSKFNLVQLDNLVQFKQKQALTKVALLRAARGEIGITNIISMLRG